MTWDLCYMFTRPRSFPGGDLHWIWQPYALYGKVDKVYGREAWEKQEGWPTAQSFCNIIEVCFWAFRGHFDRSLTRYMILTTIFRRLF